MNEQPEKVERPQAIGSRLLGAYLRGIGHAAEPELAQGVIEFISCHGVLLR